MSLMNYYQMLQNASVTAFTVSRLLRENQQGGVKLPLPTQIKSFARTQIQVTINPICSCDDDVESTEHFLLYCLQFVNGEPSLLKKIGNIDH